MTVRAEKERGVTQIALIADLHFGSVPARLADQLALDLERIRPDLIIVAGDLTMRSTRTEFADAKVWLEGLKAPLLVLPGNHDLPVWSFFERFTNPFARYSHASGAKLMPVFEDRQSFILGLNTTASWQPSLRWQDGTVRRRDVACARLLLAQAPPEKARIVATHHPLSAIEGLPLSGRPVRRAARAMAVPSLRRANDRDQLWSLYPSNICRRSAWLRNGRHRGGRGTALVQQDGSRANRMGFG